MNSVERAVLRELIEDLAKEPEPALAGERWSHRLTRTVKAGPRVAI